MHAQEIAVFPSAQYPFDVVLHVFFDLIGLAKVDHPDAGLPCLVVQEQQRAPDTLVVLQ